MHWWNGRERLDKGTELVIVIKRKGRAINGKYEKNVFGAILSWQLHITHKFEKVETWHKTLRDLNFNQNPFQNGSTFVTDSHFCRDFSPSTIVNSIQNIKRKVKNGKLKIAVSAQNARMWGVKTGENRQQQTIGFVMEMDVSWLKYMEPNHWISSQCYSSDSPTFPAFTFFPFQGIYFSGLNFGEKLSLEKEKMNETRHRQWHFVQWPPLLLFWEQPKCPSLRPLISVTNSPQKPGMNGRDSDN